MRFVSVLCICLALVLVAGAAMADPNNAGMKSWTNDLGGARATYAEVEPNDTCPGQQVYCGDDVNPAYLEPGGADWYTFSANAGDLLTLATYSINGSSVDTVIELYTNDCVSMLTSNDDNPFPFSMIFNYPAPYTGVYNLKVRGYNSGISGDYGVSFRCGGAPPPPENDTCATAMPIERCTAGTITGDLTNAAADYSPTNGCTGYAAGAAGKDLVYLLNLVVGDQVHIVVTPQGYDAAIYILSDCSNMASCVEGADDPEDLSWTCDATGTYYFMSDAYATGGGGAFTMDYSIVCANPEACCFDDGSCQMLMAGDCTAQGGHPQGMGTTCDGVVCEVVPVQNTTWGQIRAQYR